MNTCHHLLAIAALVLLSNSTFADILIGRVIHITDGDTLKVLDDDRVQHTIRLAGIDTPERKQAFGAKATRHLSDMVKGKTVTVEYKKRDRHQRIVGKITLNETDICLEQIKAGLAWHYKKYEREQPEADRITYAAEEVAARERKIGLWSDPYQVPPWEFRKLRSK